MDPNGIHMNYPFTINTHLAVRFQSWAFACFDVCFNFQWIHLLYLEIMRCPQRGNALTNST